MLEELDDVLPDLFGIFRDRGQRSGQIAAVREDDGLDLIPAARDIRRADAVSRMCQRDRLPIRRLFALINICHTFQCQRFGHCDLHDDGVGFRHIGRGIADRSRRDQITGFRDRQCFHQRDIRFLDMAGRNEFRAAAEVHIDVADLIRVDRFAQRRVGLIRDALADRAGFRQFRIDFRADRSAGVKVDLHLAARLDLLGECVWDCFRVTGVGKAADADRHAVPDHFGSRFCAHDQRFCACIA